MDSLLVNQYINEVLKRIPRKNRNEVRAELEKLITEKMKNDNTNEEDVLKQLGNPAILARNYTTETPFIISKEYYFYYIFVLKIALICVTISSIISGLIESFTDSAYSSPLIVSFYIKFFSNFISNLIVNLITGGLIVFGGVTLVFGILQHYNVNLESSKDSNWTPSNLKTVQHRKHTISRSDCIVSIIFTVLFAMLLIMCPQFIGAFTVSDGKIVKYIPVLNLAQWSQLLPLILCSLLFGFIDNIIRLINGCYNTLVLISSIVTGTLELILSIILLKFLPFFNPSFASDLSVNYNLNFSSDGDIMYYWGTSLIPNIVLTIIIISIGLSIGITVYRTTRQASLAK